MKSCPACGESYADSFAHCPRDGSALMVSSGWTDGAVIRGKYRIVAKIGQGGMGEVYKALHLRFNEVRALKVMSSQLASDSSFVKRFEQEAVNTRRLQHPNAVRVDDIDESEDGRPFIVMEYIEGRSLKSLIESEGPQPVERTCRIIKQAASALAAAHEMGMVHRDIKPENIVLVSNSGGEQAKVLDFGIAKLKEAGPGQGAGMTLTGTGVVIGTPQYMSPEQAMGKRGDELDGRSDLYSLGIVMYQMLSGELPFKADTTIEMLMAHIQVPPRPIQSLCPDLKIPEAVAAVVMKCLEKKPEHRPAHAAALIQELERAEKLSAVPVAATRVASSAPPLRVEPSLAPPEPPPRPRAQPPPPRPSAPSPAAQARPAAPRPAATPSIKIQTVEGSRRNLWVGVTAGALVLGLMVWYFSSRPAAQNQNGPATTPTGSSGAAVAPAQQSAPAVSPETPPARPPQAAAGRVVGGVPGGMPGGTPGGVLGSIQSAAVPPPPPQATTPKRIRVGGQVEQAKLIFKPTPEYPPLAKVARIQGEVRLEAIISRDGTVQDLKVLSGHPLLIKSALEAVQRWRYQPTLVNGEPVEIITEIDVNFTLAAEQETKIEAPPLGAPAAKGLSKEDLIKLLNAGVVSSRVYALVNERGISFELTPEVEQELRRAGANSYLIMAVRAHSKPPAVVNRGWKNRAEYDAFAAIQRQVNPDMRKRLARDFFVNFPDSDFKDEVRRMAGIQ